MIINFNLNSQETDYKKFYNHLKKIWKNENLENTPTFAVWKKQLVNYETKNPFSSNYLIFDEIKLLGNIFQCGYEFSSKNAFQDLYYYFDNYNEVEKVKSKMLLQLELFKKLYPKTFVETREEKLIEVLKESEFKVINERLQSFLDFEKYKSNKKLNQKADAAFNENKLSYKINAVSTDLATMNIFELYEKLFNEITKGLAIDKIDNTIEYNAAVQQQQSAKHKAILYLQLKNENDLLVGGSFVVYFEKEPKDAFQFVSLIDKRYSGQEMPKWMKIKLYDRLKKEQPSISKIFAYCDSKNLEMMRINKELKFNEEYRNRKFLHQRK